MLTVVEVLLMVISVILPLRTPKKKLNHLIDTNISDAHYAIDEDGYIVKLHS